MKGTAVKVKGNDTRRQRGVVARVQMKPRPGAGNRHRQHADSFERQADEMSGRMLRHESGLAHRISAATAAGYKNPASTGSPLRADVRIEMEESFGADLSAVRIHTSGAAAAAARAEGAIAFTSGRDIYFDSGRFAPTTTEGKRLLAHELTHVLQQTGRAGSGNKWVATPVEAAGLIQRQDSDHSDDKVAFLASADKAFEVLASRHGNRTDADESLKGLIEIIRSWGGGRIYIKETSDLGKVLLRYAREGQYHSVARTMVALTPPASAFLLDCLKVTGLEEHFEAAALLLDGDTTFALKTAFGPRTHFREFLKRSKREDDWVAEAFKHEPLKKFWPYQFLNTVEQFVLNPWRQIQTLEGFAEAKTAALENIHGEKNDLLYNDRVLLAFELLEDCDNQRRSWMSRIEKKLAKDYPNQSVVSRRFHNARMLRQNFDEMLSQPFPAFWIDMLRTLRTLADRAERFWPKAQQFQTVVTDTFVKADRSDLLTDFMKLERPFAEDDPVMAPLRRALASMGAPDGLFFLDSQGKATDVPTPGDYERRIAALSQTVGLTGSDKDNFLLQVQQELIRTYRREGLDSTKALGLGWMLRWGMTFHDVLSSYSATMDEPAYADGRLAHRSRVASTILAVAQVGRWPDIRDMAGRIIRGLDRDVSYLAVPGQWQVEPDIPVAKMETDFPGDKPMAGSLGLRPSHLGRFFHGQFLQSLAGAITESLDRARRDPKEDLDSKALHQKVEALPRPWRCTPDRSAVLVLRDEDRAKTGTMSNREIINNSPKSLDEFHRLSAARRLGPNPKRITIDDPPIVQPIFAWLIPDFLPIVTVLKGSEPFTTRMTGSEGLPDKEWLEKLVELSGATFDQDILTVINTDIKRAHVTFIDAVRQFTAFRRRSTSSRLAADLKPYKNTFEYRKVPKAVAEEIWHFPADPREDSDSQRALLVLSLAPRLASAFPSARQAVKIPPYFLAALTKTLEFVATARQDTAAGAPAEKRKSVEDLLFRNDVDPTRGEQIADFLANEKKISDLIAHMEEARRELQEEWGFRSEDGVTLQSIGSNEKLKAGPEHAMEINGEDWELVEVYQKFTYHPALDFSSQKSRAADPILKDEQGHEDTLNNKPLATFLKNGDEYEIISGDSGDPVETLKRERELKALSEALFWHTRGMEMGDLKETLDEGGYFMIEVMELIPAIGQELMVARLGINIVTFLGEVPKIAKALKNHPIEHLKEVGRELESHGLETIMLYLLLGEGREPLLGLRKIKPDETGVELKGNLAKAIAFLRRLGILVADAVRWVRLRVAGPVRALQSSIATRPKLGWLLQRAVDVAFYQSQLALSADSSSGVTRQERMLAVLAELIPIGYEPPENATDQKRKEYPGLLLATIQTEMTTQAEHFKLMIDATLDHFQEAVLPGKIIRVNRVIEALIDFFLSRLGAKVKAAKRLLEHTDKYKQLRAKIGSELGDMVEGSQFDPNVYWRDLVLNKIDARLRVGRNELMTGIYGRIHSIAEAGGLDFLKLERPPDKEEGKFGLERTEPPLAEADTLHGPVPARQRLAELPTTPGQPLAASVRLVEERRFGHDLGHVRLHTGSETGPELDGLGANALTSGSHVFLRPGLDPQSLGGARVLRHELTHVLQQTGPRPRGRVHETRPVRGRPRRGLIVDQMREAAAETMANVDTAAVAREPIEANAGAEGVQPNVEGAVTGLLARLTTFQSASDFDKPTDGKPVPGEGDAKNFLEAVHTRLARGEFKFKNFVTDVRHQLSAHIAARVKEEDMRGVAALGQKPAKGARGNRPKNTTLDFPRFVTLLEGFIFARSGVAMQIEISQPAAPRLKSLEVTYVHFGVISPTSPTGKALWDAVMKATPKIGAGDDPTKLRAEIYARLAALGPDPFVWKATEPRFGFSDEFVEAFNKLVKARKKDLETDLPVIGPKPEADPAIDPKPLNEYLNPGSVGTQPTQKGVGLRVGKHQGQQGTDRESHHTTQYLLVQYFRNNNTVPAWRAGLEYPGINPIKGPDRVFFQADKRPKLDLEKLDQVASSRGAGMPAILISADLHKRGRLHVNRETRWTGSGSGQDPDSEDEQGGGAVRQGYAIERVFKAALKNKFGVRDDDGSRWADAVNAKGKPAASVLIHDAMIETYHWMHGIMLPALEQGLKRELAYYRGIAARSHLKAGTPEAPKLESNYDLKAPDMTAVYARAKANNNKVMSEAGWTAPRS